MVPELHKLLEDMGFVKAMVHQIAVKQDEQGDTLKTIVEERKREQASRTARKDVIKLLAKVLGAVGFGGGSVAGILNALGN